MKKIVALTNNPAFVKYEHDTLSALDGVEFVISPAETENELCEAIKEADVVIFTAAKLNRRVIDSTGHCGLLIRCGIGYDTVDLAAAYERGIYVCNTPNYGVIDVAEHAFSLLLATAKRLTAMHERIKNGIWSTAGIGASTRIAGKTVGFVGFGNIGRTVCARTNVCGMRPVVYDPFVTEKQLTEYGAEAVTLDKLLEISDFVTLHLPLNEKTHHILGAEQFAKMKSGAILINTARGGLVDEAALIDALVSGKLGGAGLDVFEDEKGGMDKRMLEAKNVVLTPHVAWNTPDAIVTLHKDVADNIIRYLNGERPSFIVNGL